MVVDFLEYLPEKVTQLITGAVLHVGSTSGSGSKARAETESDEAEGMIQFDREVIDEALTDCLVAQVWRLTRGNLVAPGLGEASMPWFATIRQKRENPAENAQVAATLLNAGVPRKVAEIMEAVRAVMEEWEPKLVQPATEADAARIRNLLGEQQN
jgi:hypothetical protein